MLSYVSSRHTRTLLRAVQRASRTYIVPALFCLGASYLLAACGSAPEESQDQTPVPQSEFNLQGTWKWYDRYELPTGCLIRIWPEGSKWNGWIVQDFGEIQQCTRVDHRLDRVNMDGTRVSLWFKLPDTERLVRRELRLEVVTPSRLRSRSSNTPYTLVKVSG